MCKKNNKILQLVWFLFQLIVFFQQICYELPYLWSQCLNVFKVASVLLKSDGSLVEEPLERHIQWSVMCGLTAQHHALSYGHLHPVRAKLHTHGICKHKTAALSPQANPDFLWRCSIWLWITWKSENKTQAETKGTFNTITLKSRWGLVHARPVCALLCVSLCNVILQRESHCFTGERAQ